jgi:hypothetical protein
MMLGHIIRQELNELENEMRRIGEEMFLRHTAARSRGRVHRCRCGRTWRRARSPGTLQRAHGFYLNQDDVAAFLSRVGLDAERMVDVFPSAQDAAMLPP